VFSAQVRNLDRCASYEDAVELFKTPPLRGKAWAENERPLGGSRAHHYRVERRDDSYRVYLYSTCMARYAKPEGNERHVEYSWDNRTTSTQFMYYVVRVGSSRDYMTTDGRKVRVPMTSGGVALTLVDGKLDISRSSHPEQYAYRMSERDKEKRKALRAELKTLCSLAAIRYQTPTAGLKPMDRWWSALAFGPFKGPEITYDIQKAVAKGLLDSPDFMEAFLDGAQVICEFSRGRAAYNDLPVPGLDKLEAALMTWILKMRGANGKNERVALPLFPEVE